MKRTIIVGLILTILIGLIGLSYWNSRYVKNDANAIGNTAGNLYNGGLFCENEGMIYFSNPDDDGALYVMDEDMQHLKKLSSDNSSYINVTNHYIVYVRDNHNRKKLPGQFLNFNTVGLFRMDKKTGNNVTQLYGKPAGLTSLIGNDIFYQHYDAKEGLYFYHTTLNRKENSLVLEEAIEPASYQNGHLYFTGAADDHAIHAMNLSEQTIQDVYNGNCYQVIASGDALYYLDLSNNYSIASVSFDGSAPVTLVNERCSFFNISPTDNAIYYQVDGGDKNRLCYLDLSTMKSKTLKKGDFNSIHITKNYVFFKKFDSDTFYYLDKASDKIKAFHPGTSES